MSQDQPCKGLLNIKLIKTEPDLLSSLSRAKKENCYLIAQQAQDLLDKSKQVLRLLDSPYAIWSMPSSDSLCLEHQDVSDFDLAYILTIFISTAKYSMIVLVGYLTDLRAYLPRLRWILSYYDCRLILLQD